MSRTLEMDILNGLAQAHSEWIEDGVAANFWNAHMLTVMFKRLPGPMVAKDAQMHDAIENCFYPKLCCRLDRHPGRPGRHQFLPFVVLFPDLPGPKSVKPPIALNGGLHYQGVICISPQARLKELLPDHFKRHHKHYAGERIERFDVKRIFSAPKDVINYTMKTVMARRTDYNRAIILPKSLSELRAPRPFSESERAMKDLQSATNWSDELAAVAVSAKGSNRAPAPSWARS